MQSLTVGRLQGNGKRPGRNARKGRTAGSRADALRPGRAVGLPGPRSVPRFLGTFAALAFLGATIGYGLDLSGRGEIFYRDVVRASGLTVQSVRINGIRETETEDVLDAAAIWPDTPMPFFDASGARDRLKALPWVADATVRRLFPSVVEIDVKEREPYALWSHDGTVSVVDRTGTVIDAPMPAAAGTLLMLAGEGAPARATEAVNIVGMVPEAAPRIRAAVLVGERRWDVVLDNGILIHLPEATPEVALAEVMRLDREQQLLERAVVSIDMRLPDRMAIRMTPDASKDREEAIKKLRKAQKAGVNT